MLKSKTIDLHTHSKASDGSLSPAALIRLAVENNLSAIALTDHDTTDGIDEAKGEAKKLNFEFIPGIELSCDFDRELHIIGLYIDNNNEYLKKAEADLKKEREKRNKYVLDKLNGAGIVISWEDVIKESTGNIFGRAHIAKAMVEKKYVQNTKEAFRKYLGHGRVGFAMEGRLKPKKAIETIKKSGGFAILAHCHYLGFEGDELLDFLKRLKEYGLDGLEVFYTEYTKKQQEEYMDAAKKLNLLISGGTDFHGKTKPDIALGSGFGNLEIPYELLYQFKKHQKI